MRCVVTLATPLRDVTATHAARLVPLRPGGRPLREAHELRAWLRTPRPVPTTSIDSKSDGIVAWQSCLEQEGETRENVEVVWSHTGMGFHAETLAIVADRLSQPEGAWRASHAGRNAARARAPRVRSALPIRLAARRSRARRPGGKPPWPSAII